MPVVASAVQPDANEPEVGVDELQATMNVEEDAEMLCKRIAEDWKSVSETVNSNDVTAVTNAEVLLGIEIAIKILQDPKLLLDAEALLEENVHGITSVLPEALRANPLYASANKALLFIISDGAIFQAHSLVADLDMAHDELKAYMHVLLRRVTRMEIIPDKKDVHAVAALAGGLNEVHLEEERVITLTEQDRWAGCLRRHKESESAIRIWGYQTGRQGEWNEWGLECSALEEDGTECNKEVTCGAHVWLESHLQRNVHYIMPSCAKHNANTYAVKSGWFEARPGAQAVRIACAISHVTSATKRCVLPDELK